MANKNNHQRYHTHISWIISCILGLLLVGSITNQVFAQAQQSQDEQQVKNAVLSAFTISQRVVVLPNTTSVLSKSTSPKAAMPLKSDIDTAMNLANNQFNSVYSQNCAKCKVIASRIEKSLVGQQDGSYRALGWSIRNPQWSQLIIQGQTASVTFSATLSSKLFFFDEFHQPHTVNPTQTLVFNYTLQKSDNRWLVINLIEDTLTENALPANQLTPSGQTGGPPPGVVPPKKIITNVQKTPTPTK
jgi:hypothetical protein